MSADPSVNPDFADANFVYVPYCSSDTHRGTRTTADADTFGFYFSGHLNLIAIVEDVKTQHAKSFAAMERMLLTGGSAGGGGTIYNADWLGSVLPSSVDFKAAPSGGWFEAGNYPDQVAAGRSCSGPSLFPDFVKGVASDRTNASAGIDALWKSILPDACVSTHPATPAQDVCESAVGCGTAHVAYHYVKTPLFIMENMYDTNQISAQSGLKPYKYNTKEGQEFIKYVTGDDSVTHPPTLYHTMYCACMM